MDYSFPLGCFVAVFEVSIAEMIKTKQSTKLVYFFWSININLKFCICNETGYQRETSFYFYKLCNARATKPDFQQ